MSKLAEIVLMLTLMAVGALGLAVQAHGTPAPVGLSFDHIIIIAMENTNYADLNDTWTPFIMSLLPYASNMSDYIVNQNINNCSAGCYQASTSGQQTVSDSWCDGSSGEQPPCLSTGSGTNNIANQLNASFAGSAMFCEDSCPRHADHFPWLGYSNTYNSCITTTAYTVNCNGQTGSAGDRLYNTVDALCTGSCATCSSSCGPGTAYTTFQSPGNSNFINYLNNCGTGSGDPACAQYIWFTPTDCHNMHDLCGGAKKGADGDYYLGSLLCDCASWTGSNAATGTVFASSLWTAGHTLLYLWWDEPRTTSSGGYIANIVYGPGIRSGYTSSSTYGHYYALHTIERNWGLGYISSVVAGDSSLTNIFTPAVVVTGPNGVVNCDQCVTSVDYRIYTLNDAGTATYTTNSPTCGTGCTQWNVTSGSKNLGADDSFGLRMQFGSTDQSYYCSSGTFTSTFTVNGVQKQLSTHVNCENSPGH